MYCRQRVFGENGRTSIGNDDVEPADLFTNRICQLGTVIRDVRPPRQNRDVAVLGRRFPQRRRLGSVTDRAKDFDIRALCELEDDRQADTAASTGD